MRFISLSIKIIRQVGQSLPKWKGVSKNIEIYGTESCPFCQDAKQMFEKMGAPFQFIDTNKNPQKRQELQGKHNWRTVPMIFVDGKFQGGFTDIKKKIDSRELII